MADDLGDDVQTQLDSLKPQPSPYAKALSNLIGAPGSDTAKLQEQRDAQTMKADYVARAGGVAHDDHQDYKVGHDPGYQRPPRNPSGKSHHRRV